jgi:hypothetical protein
MVVIEVEKHFVLYGVCVEAEEAVLIAETRWSVSSELRLKKRLSTEHVIRYSVTRWQHTSR